MPLAYTLGFVVVFGLLGLIINTTATQIRSLVDHLPTYQRQFKMVEPQLVTNLQPLGVTPATLNSGQQQAVTSLHGIGTTAAAQSLSVVTGVIGTSIDAIADPHP